MSRLIQEMRNPKAFARRVASLFKLEFYYIMEEFQVPADKVPVPSGVANLEVVPLTRDDLDFLGTHPEGDVPTKWLVCWFDEGHRGLAIKCRGEIAAYSWYALDHFEYLGRKFLLGPDEAYLYNARTYVAYRGKNLAPYLRNELTKRLAQQGVKRYYSITVSSNKASRRFKQKLGAKPVELGVRLRLYRFRRNFCLKRYSSSGPKEIH